MENGSIRGLKIHSGHVISLTWKASKVISMEICAEVDDEIVINATHLSSNNAEYKPCQEGITILLKEGNRYDFFAIK
jgi:hypothetical protein